MEPQLNTKHDPVIGQHWSVVDLQHLMARRMYALVCELEEVGADIPPKKLFMLETLGYSVDLDSGIVGAECEVPYAG